MVLDRGRVGFKPVLQVQDLANPCAQHEIQTT
jgi:hypothetical protein